MFLWNLFVKLIMLVINVTVLIICFIYGLLKLPTGKDAWTELSNTMTQGITNISQLLMNIGSLIGFFIWGLMTSPFSEKPWENLEGAMFCPKNPSDKDQRNKNICFTGGCISLFLGYEGGSLMTSFIVFLLVGAIIFAAPIILVVRNRLMFNSEHQNMTIEEAIHEKEVQIEGVLLMLKYILVFGVKMMIEYYLWKVEHPYTKQ
jgi:hypothetical protein